MIFWHFHWPKEHLAEPGITRAFEVSCAALGESETWCCSRPPLRIARPTGRQYSFTVRAVLFAERRDTATETVRCWVSPASLPVALDLRCATRSMPAPDCVATEHPEDQATDTTGDKAADPALGAAPCTEASRPETHSALEASLRLQTSQLDASKGALSQSTSTPSEEESLERLSRALRTLEMQQPSASSHSTDIAGSAKLPKEGAVIAVRSSMDADLAGHRYAPAPQKVNLGAAYLSAAPAPALEQFEPPPALLDTDGDESDGSSRDSEDLLVPRCPLGQEYARRWMQSTLKQLQAHWKLVEIKEAEFVALLAAQSASSALQTDEADVTEESSPDKGQADEADVTEESNSSKSGLQLRVHLNAGRSEVIDITAGEKTESIVESFVSEHNLDAALKDLLCEHIAGMIRDESQLDSIDAMDLLMRDMRSL